jgi:hypothetical protein
LRSDECFNAREADELFNPIFQDVTNQMFDKMLKKNLKMSFDEAKEFYLGQNYIEKEFIDLVTLYGLENKPEVIIQIILKYVMSLVQSVWNNYSILKLLCFK